jgi:hypothetical protein
VAATHALQSAAVIPALQSAVATRAAQIHATLVQLEPHPIAASALYLVLPAQTPVLQGAGAILVPQSADVTPVLQNGAVTLVPLNVAAIPAPQNEAAILAQRNADAILVPLKGAATPVPLNVAAIHVALVVLRQQSS